MDKSIRIALVAAIFAISTGVRLGAVDAPTLNAQVARRTFLPVVVQTTGGLFGRVTHEGRPVSDISVDLFFCVPVAGGKEPVSCQPQRNVKTDQNGYFRFSDLESIGTPDVVTPTIVAYRASWGVVDRSNRRPGYLQAWRSRPITTYTRGTWLEIGNFDIAGITLIRPTIPTTTPLPFDFVWSRRTVAQAETYRVCMSANELTLDPEPSSLLGSTYCAPTPTLNTTLSVAEILNTQPNSGPYTRFNTNWAVYALDPSGGIGFAGTSPLSITVVP